MRGPKSSTERVAVHVFVKLRPSEEGCYAKARIEGAPDNLPRTFLGVLESRDGSEATSLALGWVRRLRRQVRKGG